MNKHVEEFLDENDNITIWKSIKYYVNYFYQNEITRQGLLYFVKNSVTSIKNPDMTVDTVRHQLTVLGYLSHTQTGTYYVNKQIEEDLSSSKLRKLYDDKSNLIEEKEAQ